MEKKYFGHLMRREDSLEKTLMLGKCEGKRRRGRQRMRWLGSVIEATNMNLTQLREAGEDRRAWRVLVRGVTKSRTQLNNNNIVDRLAHAQRQRTSSGNGTQPTVSVHARALSWPAHVWAEGVARLQARMLALCI